MDIAGAFIWMGLILFVAYFLVFFVGVKEPNKKRQHSR